MITDDQLTKEELIQEIRSLREKVKQLEAESKYIPERFPVEEGTYKCEICDEWATHYEYPIKDDPEFIYAACDKHWKEHDETNQGAL